MEKISGRISNTNIVKINENQNIKNKIVFKWILKVSKICQKKEFISNFIKTEGINREEKMACKIR
jgi:hypothetical protein